MAVQTMVIVAVLVVVLPFFLLGVFHGADVADSRGRRLGHRWRVDQRRR